MGDWQRQQNLQNKPFGTKLNRLRLDTGQKKKALKESLHHRSEVMKKKGKPVSTLSLNKWIKGRVFCYVF